MTSEEHPLVAALVASEDEDSDAETIEYWRNVFARPDTIVKAFFGSSFDDVLFGDEGWRQAVKNELHPLVIDDENNSLRLLPRDKFELQMNQLRSYTTWSFSYHPAVASMYFLCTAMWRSPLIPAFEAQLTITQDTLATPNQWVAVGRFGVDGEDDNELTEMEVKLDPTDRSIELVNKDRDDIGLRTVCSEYVWNKLTNVAEVRRGLEELLASEDYLKKSYNATQPSGLKDIMLNKAAVQLFKDSTYHRRDPKVDLVDNGDKVPEVGGARAAWLAKEGALDVDRLHDLDGDKDKAEYVHRSDLDYAKHQRATTQDNDDHVLLTHRIDELEKLLAGAHPDAFALQEGATDKVGRDDALREWHDHPAVASLPMKKLRPRKTKTESDSDNDNDGDKESDSEGSEDELRELPRGQEKRIVQQLKALKKE